MDEDLWKELAFFAGVFVIVCVLVGVTVATVGLPPQ